MVKVVVDMTGCGFSSAPVVHAMLNGDNHNVQTKVSVHELCMISKFPLPKVNRKIMNKKVS